MSYALPGTDLHIKIGQVEAAVVDPDVDGTPYVVLAMPVTVTTGAYTAFEFGSTFLALGPSTASGSDDLGGYVAIAALQSTSGGGTRTSATIAAACGSRPLFGDAVSALPQDPTTSAFDLSIPAATTVSGCVPFEIRGSDHPTTLRVYTDSYADSSSAPAAAFEGVSFTSTRPAVQPTTLASWSGSGSELITVDEAVQQQAGKVCWSMPDGGYNSITLQTTTAGDGFELLTNVVGAVSDCSTQTLKTYMQVLSSGSWTITATNF